MNYRRETLPDFAKPFDLLSTQDAEVASWRIKPPSQDDAG
jgi:hypothetical protein